MLQKEQIKKNKGVIFKSCAPFTDCISEINNTEIDNAKDIDVVMPIYNLIEYNDNYSKISKSSWRYYRDESAAAIVNSKSLKYKIRIIGKTPADGIVKDVKINIPLKYLSNFWGTFEVSLINYEINIIFTWSEKCVISSPIGPTKFGITDVKLYVPVITLSTQDNIKLLKQLELSFKRTLNWIKLNYRLKIGLIEKYTQDIFFQKKK